MMKKEMANYAISTWIVNELDWRQAIAMLAESGFSMVELSGSDSSLVSEWEKDCVATMRAIESAGLAVASVHCSREGRAGIDSPDEAVRKACIEVNFKYFDRMKDCGIPEIVIHPGVVSGGAIGRYSTVRDSLKRLGDRAEKKGIRIAVENLGDTRIESLVKLIDGIGSHVGICLDIGHSVINGHDPFEELRFAIASEMLFSLHLHDADAKGYDHLVPGKGCIDTNAVTDELDRAGFTGLRTIELRPSSDTCDIAGRLAESKAIHDSWLGRNKNPS